MVPFTIHTRFIPCCQQKLRQSHLFKFTAYRIEEKILISVFHWLLVYVFTMKNNQLFSTNREDFRYPKSMVTITINDWETFLHLAKAFRCTICLQQCVCITSGSYRGGMGIPEQLNGMGWCCACPVASTHHELGCGRHMKGKWSKTERDKKRVAARPVISSTGRVPETELGFYDTMCYWGHFNCACCTKYSLPNVSTDSSLLPFHPAGSSLNSAIWYVVNSVMFVSKFQCKVIGKFHI